MFIIQVQTPILKMLWYWGGLLWTTEINQAERYPTEAAANKRMDHCEKQFPHSFWQNAIVERR